MVISGYANTENVFYCLIIIIIILPLLLLRLKLILILILILIILIVIIIVIIINNMFIMKNLTYFRKPMETVVDPRLPLHTIPSQQPLTNSIVPSQICKRLLKTGLTEAHTFRFIDLALKKGWHFFLCRIYLSSSYPKSHDESWSLQGRLQRSLTKRGSNSSRSTLVTLSLTFCHSVSYSS